MLLFLATPLLLILEMVMNVSPLRLPPSHQLPRPQLPEGSLRQLLLAPAGVVRMAHTPAATTPAAATPGAAGADANTIGPNGGGSSDMPASAGGWPVGTDLLNGERAVGGPMPHGCCCGWAGHTATHAHLQPR